MKGSKKESREQKALVRRYLIWCYKTTKEALDRIDRKFTQLLVDRFILKELEGRDKKDKDLLDANSLKSYQQKREEFEQYILAKEQEAYSVKFSDQDHHVLKADYLYLKNRLTAVEKAICHFLGEKGLGYIQSHYEDEMTRRILEAREER